MTPTRSAPEPVIDWRDVPPEEREAHYNPRATVADAERLLAMRSAESSKVRARIPGAYDLRYGPGPKQTFDLHRPQGAEGATPALIFIHGGFWRALDKSDHSFVAPAFLDAGMAVVNLNYDLCPAVTLTELTAQVLDGIQHVVENAGRLGLDPVRIHLMGHSAGAHGVAMALAADWKARGLSRHPIHAAVCISGVYDPRVLLHISVNQEAKLTPEIAAENDALARAPLPGPAILITVGGDEPPGWIGQSLAYHALCRRAGLDCRVEIVPDMHHFSVLSTAVDPTRPEHRLVLDFLQTA